MASGGAATDPVTVGWIALTDGRWDAARAAFEDALARTRTPVAFEGLSWAAWWLDDAATVFDARSEAYRLYRRAGEAAAAARMATWLAADQVDFRGAVAIARGWLERARRLLDGLDQGPDHGWLAFHDGYLAHAYGDGAGTRERAVSAAEIGRRFDVVDLEMLGLALEGAVLVASGDVDDGMRRLDEATAIALEGEATIPISGAWVCCFLVTACTAVSDYARAFQWCDRIADFAERYGSRYMLAFCRAEYGAVHLWRGQWAEAESMLVSSLDDFSRSRPAWVEAPLVTLAELRRRQGRLADATRLLDQASGSPTAQLCRAHLALDRGETRRAADLLERVLRQLPPDRALDRVPALQLMITVRLARGELDAAAGALTSVREAERETGSAPLRAGADMAEGMLVAAGGDHDTARPLLEDAVDRFERAGSPFEAARARIELAATLVALGRSDAARTEATAALRCLHALGAATDANHAQQLLDAASALRRAGKPQLTAREQEVLRLVCAGLTNRRIAERLVISEHTVHRHVTNTLRKLGLHSRTAAAAYAVRSDLLDDAVI